MSWLRASCASYIDAGSPAAACSSTRVKASALRERCATTWARDHPGSSEGRRTDCSSRCVSAARYRVVARRVSSTRGSSVDVLMGPSNPAAEACATRYASERLFERIHHLEDGPWLTS